MSFCIIIFRIECSDLGVISIIIINSQLIGIIIICQMSIECCKNVFLIIKSVFYTLFLNLNQTTFSTRCSHHLYAGEGVSEF